MTTTLQRRDSSGTETGSEGSDATTGYEAELWKMADALRGSMDAAEYKHVVLGLIFLKYVSDAFEEARRQLKAESANGADPNDPDEYRGPKHLLGACRGALATSPGAGPAVQDRSVGG